jgi:hypothetical protein
MTGIDQAAADYRAEMDQLGALAHRMAALKLDWLAHTIDLAESVGPTVYPTMYRHADLDGQRRLVAAAQTVRGVLADITGGQGR